LFLLLDYNQILISVVLLQIKSIVNFHVIELIKLSINKNL
jgi:hypothetical protein